MHTTYFIQDYMGPTPVYGARAEKPLQNADFADFAMKQTNICRLSGDIMKTPSYSSVGLYDLSHRPTHHSVSVSSLSLTLRRFTNRFSCFYVYVGRSVTLAATMCMVRYGTYGVGLTSVMLSATDSVARNCFVSINSIKSTNPRAAPRGFNDVLC